MDKNPVVHIGPKFTHAGVLYTINVVEQYKKELEAKGKAAHQVEHFLDR